MLLWLEKWAQQHPDKVAIEEPSASMTYGALWQAVQQAVSKLLPLPLHTVAIDMPNGSAWVIAHLACLELAIPQVPLPPFFTPQQREHALRDAGVDAVLVAETSPAATLPVALQWHYCPPVSLPQGTALITYTSGSTGTPKGVCLSRAGMERVTRSLIDMLGQDLAQRHLSVLPLAVLLEQVGGLYAALLAGGTYVVRDEPLPVALRQANATSCILVPELLKSLLQARGSYPALRFVAVGGARVDEALLQEAAAQGLPVYQGYGLSESASVVAVNSPLHNKVGTVGQVLPHIRYKIAEDGEIILTAPALLGYTGGDAWTGYYPTGDLGAVDDDGYLTIRGRKKNLLITSYGRNVSPEWPESVLLAQPAIMQAMVFGDANASLSALLVPGVGSSAEAVAEAVGQANAQLPEYARIGNWRCRAPFTPANGELTGTGRIRREAILKTLSHEDVDHGFLQPA